MLSNGKTIRSFVGGYVLGMFLSSTISIFDTSGSLLSAFMDPLKQINSLFQVQVSKAPIKITATEQNSISMFDQNFSFQNAHNLSIMFLGDPFLANTYLSLVHYLHSNSTQWIDSNQTTKNPVMEQSFIDWVDFYTTTNTHLAPYENCDCYRQDGKLKVGTWTQNRFYYNPETQNNIAYILKYGNFDAHWSWENDQIHSKGYYNNGVKNDPGDVFHLGWGDWTTTITDFICKLAPKYKVLVFNAGFSPEFKHETFQTDIVQATRDCGMKSVFVTTKKNRGETDTETAEVEKNMCQKADYCLDLSWTGKVPPKFYWNRYFLMEPVYRMINTQLLGLLEKDDDDTLMTDVK